MKLGTRLFAAFVAIVTLCFAYPTAIIAHQVRIVYLESAEEPLVDTANIMAELVGQELERGTLDLAALYDTASRVTARSVSARIYKMLKDKVDLGVYITDDHGKVLFDSRGHGTLGKDYSRWRDVSRTLAGGYGARVSGNRANPSLPRVLYVAAPILVRGRIAGSLTVIKPTTSVNTFLQNLRPRVLTLGAAAAFAAIALALLVSLWISQQIGRLTRYADDVREGRRVPFPKLASSELRHMGLAFEKMRASLAGQTYIEQYVRALTHEIKSPISAIRGAAEILETPTLAVEKRGHFLRNIQSETHRIQDLVDRMLELSELEVRRALPERVRVALGPILRTILEAHGPTLTQKALQVDLTLTGEPEVQGDAFLLHLALSNLIKNAIDFSPAGGRIGVSCLCDHQEVHVLIDDDGPGIPAFAITRIFERFYSLARPDTGRKSTGLGLNFVREIAALHQGAVHVANRPERGLRASLTLPEA